MFLRLFITISVIVIMGACRVAMTSKPNVNGLSQGTSELAGWSDGLSEGVYAGVFKFYWYGAKTQVENDMASDESAEQPSDENSQPAAKAFDDSRKKLLIFVPSRKLGMTAESTAEQDLKDDDLKFEKIQGSGLDFGVSLQCDGAIKKSGLKDKGQQHCSNSDGANIAVFDWTSVEVSNVEGLQTILLGARDSKNYVPDGALLTVYSKIIEKMPKVEEITLVSHLESAQIGLRLQKAVTAAVRNAKLSKRQSIKRHVMAAPLFVAADEHLSENERLDNLGIENGLMAHFDFLKTQRQITDVDDFNYEVSESVESALEIYTWTESAWKASGFSENFNDLSTLKFGSYNVLFTRLTNPSVAINGPTSSSIYPAHNFYLFWVMETMARGFKPVLSNETKHLKYAKGPSGASKVEEILRAKRLAPNGWFEQIEGGRTFKSDDDVMEFRLN